MKMLDKVLERGFLAPYTEGGLTFSCSCIEMEIETGRVLVGSFRITTDEKYKPEGYVYSSDIRMLIRTETFGGLDMEISFQYDSTGLPEGSIQQGVIGIVSNLGEYELPYTIQITSALPVSMLGTVKNLFHFANLSTTNWKEAVSLFYSKQFENILSGNDAQYKNLYRGLAGYYGNELNVDQFLEVARKKGRSDFSVNTEFINLENPSRDIEKTIEVTFINWGHSQLSIETEGDFISVNQDTIQANAESEISSFDVLISRDALTRGLNSGKISISDMRKTIEIPVSINVRSAKRQTVNSARKNRMALMELYMSYRLGQISKTDMLKKCNDIVGTAVMDKPDNIENRLYQIHIRILEKRYDDAKSSLEFAGALINTDEVSDELKGYYNYLQYLTCNDESKQDQLSRDTDYLLARNVYSWRLAWLAMYMKKDLAEDASARFEMVKQQYEYGNTSPVLFLEALSAMFINPNVMSELSDFEMAFLTFLRRHNVMASQIRNRFVFLASRENSYSNEMYELLSYCYEQDPQDETLEQICKLLMRANLTGPEYFCWYERAVDKELRINRLYEYYMMSIDLNYQGELPKLVLMYFAYRSSLDYQRNAFLYANIIRHRERYQEIYNDYEKTIKEFAVEQIAEGRPDSNLAFIYQHIIGEELYSPEYATEYGKLLFMAKVTVKSQVFKKIIVINGYLKEEQSYRIYNDEVIIPLCGNNYSLLLEDEAGNRYMDEALFSMEYVVKSPGNMAKVMRASNLDLYPALYMVENSGENFAVSEDTEGAFMWLSYSESICEEFRIQLMIKLLEYYFERDDIGKIDELLLRFDPAVLDCKDREICIKVLVARGMYEVAFDWLRTYGIESIDYKILVRLCDRMLARTDEEYDLDMLKICQSIFQLGKYDEDILRYLLMYQSGLTGSLKSLWRAADSFDLDVHTLLENMLIQLLYSGAHIGEEENIFNEYISVGANLELEKMFLDKLAYDYFVCQRKVDTDVFDRIIYYNQMGERVSEYSMLAYLKKSADNCQKFGLGKEEAAVALMYLREMDRVGIYFPFFANYRNLWNKLDMYQDRCFIEYRGNVGNKVVLHYVIEKSGQEEEEFRKEEMPHMLGGIYIWSYVLFYGEKIRYYITEEESRQEKLTKSDSLEKNEKRRESAEYRYGNINNIVISRDMNDDLTFIQLAEEYSKKKYLVDRLFTGETGGRS